MDYAQTNCQQIPYKSLILAPCHISDIYEVSAGPKTQITVGGPKSLQTFIKNMRKKSKFEHKFAFLPSVQPK